MTVLWHSRREVLDDRSAAMMNAVQALLPSIWLVNIQGSYSTRVSASSGTHSGGGAIDVGCRGLTLSQMRAIETAMRRVGWAAWLRFPNSLWDYHVHGIAIGCPDLSWLASVQVQNYFDGKSGLSGGGPDTGTRAYVGVTWETYQSGGGPIGSTPVPGGGSHVGPSWLTGAGTFLAAPTQTIAGDSELIEARFAPPRLAA